MCRFITAILPNDAGIAGSAAVFRAHGRACDVYVNASLAAQIGSGESSCHTTVGHCDCGTPMGSTALADAASDGQDPDGVDAARLRRKGWSESKIARTLTQRNEAKARPRSPLRNGPQETGLDTWCALIHALLAQPGTACVGLLIHDYRGSIDGEAIILQGRETIRMQDVSEAALASMREDTIYEFRR